MFVILALNAYVNIRYIEYHRERATPDREVDEEGVPMRLTPHYSGCFCEESRFEGSPYEGICKCCGYWCADKFCPKHLDTVAHKTKPRVSRVDWAERSFLVGLVLTTFTGIMPTIATDPESDGRLEDVMSKLHTVGIFFGVLLIAVGALHRSVPYFTVWKDIFCGTGRPVDGSPRDYCGKYGAPCCCNWVDGDYRIGPPEWLTSSLIDFIGFVIFIFVAGIFVYTSSQAGDLTYSSHYCTKYDTMDTCLGLNRDINILSLNTTVNPWPCAWDPRAVVPCTNPTCDYELNALEVVSEFWVLTMAIMTMAAYQCNTHESLLSFKKNRPWHDSWWNLEGNRSAWKTICLGISSRATMKGFAKNSRRHNAVVCCCRTSSLNIAVEDTGCEDRKTDAQIREDQPRTATSADQAMYRVSHV